MSIAAPTSKQVSLWWKALTALAVATLIAAAGIILWALGWVLNRLAAILLPLAVAGIIAYLLDPVVGFIESRGVSRKRAVVWVFILFLGAVLILLAMVVPRLVVETGLLIDRIPEYATTIQQKLREWLEQSALGAKTQDLWQSERGEEFRDWLKNAIPRATTWVWMHIGGVMAGLGMILGFALVPFYLFYFLLRKEDIEKSWTDYLPVKESKLKQEIIFVLTAINDSLIVFFRGQVLVALCVGALLTVAYSLIGLNYAVLLGGIAAVLGIIPYLGAVASLAVALVVALVQFQDWLHPLLVCGVFLIAQFLEGAVLSPRIIGGRVGMHPVVVIVAVLIGTSLLGGIVGGILAIPLAAALRAVLNRYVWHKSRPSA